MSITLATLPAREEAERTAARKRRQSITVARGVGSMLNGSDLMREITRAMLSVPGARSLDEHESDALRQSVAVSILSRRRALPRELRDLAARYADRCDLAGIGRVLRVDAAAREREPDGIARGEVGRSLLSARVRATMAQRSDWQDTAASYRTRAEAARGDRRMVEALPESADDAHAPGLLTRSLPTDPYAVDPADVPDLARAVAARLADHAPVIERRIVARLVQAMAVAGGDDAARALANLAREDGRTLNAVRIDAARGADALAAADLTPADLLRLVRAVAREVGLAREAREDRVALPPVADAAAEAVAVLTRAGGAWDPGAIGSGRSLPDRDPRTSSPADLAPFPAVSRPGAGALPVRRTRRGPGHPMAPTPAARPRRTLTAEQVNAIYLRSWGER